eukprot:3624310-Prorocentrum_lima.AAC.1
MGSWRVFSRISLLLLPTPRCSGPSCDLHGRREVALDVPRRALPADAGSRTLSPARVVVSDA